MQPARIQRISVRAARAAAFIENAEGQARRSRLGSPFGSSASFFFAPRLGLPGRSRKSPSPRPTTSDLPAHLLQLGR